MADETPTPAGAQAAAEKKAAAERAAAERARVAAQARADQEEAAAHAAAAAAAAEREAAAALNSAPLEAEPAGCEKFAENSLRIDMLEQRVLSIGKLVAAAVVVGVVWYLISGDTGSRKQIEE